VNSEELITKTALQTLDIEIKALEQLRDSINQSFIDAVTAIYQCKGRLVVTGIGKSAIIAQKIVATLNSTGTPALFMHAADAIHGDLGMIQTGDLVLCLSKSGETAEIKVLLPLLKNLSIPIIGMVSNEKSFLALQANFLLLTPVSQEADPNNLAPTASTTAQIAMGDALATSLLALKGFTSKDFALFHPGGALGKQLYLRVHDLYTRNQKPQILLSDNIQTTILEMTSKCLGATAVLNPDQELKGIITDGDLRRMLEKGINLIPLKARDIMTPAPKTIHKDALAVKALHLMQKHSITQLIIVDQPHEYLGMIHLHDLLKEGLV